MSHGRIFLKYWLPVILWMALIWTASSDAASAQRSSRIIGPLLHWLLPQLAEETMQQIVFVVRKCAHLTVFGILAWLVWRALRRPGRKYPRPWRWRDCLIALLWVALYAGADEAHQSFVPSRQGSFRDVLLDLAGAALGLAVLWAVHRARTRRENCERK